MADSGSADRAEDHWSGLLSPDGCSQQANTQREADNSANHREHNAFECGFVIATT